MQTKLRHEVGTVLFHRLFAHHQKVCNLPVTESFGHVMQHFALTRGECLPPAGPPVFKGPPLSAPCGQSPRHRRTHEKTTCEDTAHCEAHLFVVRLLEQQTIRPRRDSRVEAVAAMPAQDEYTFAPPAGPDEAGEKDTILLRQATVEQQKVRARPVTHSEDAPPLDTSATTDTPSITPNNALSPSRTSGCASATRILPPGSTLSPVTMDNTTHAPSCTVRQRADMNACQI